MLNVKMTHLSGKGEWILNLGCEMSTVLCLDKITFITQLHNEPHWLIAPR
jgi:hypothetical protein